VPVHGVSPMVWLSATATLTPLITDASGSTTSLKPVHATAHGWAVPWALPAAIVVLILAIFGARALRKRGKKREDARVQEAVEQALSGKEAAGIS
jgi:membrane protein implicated in regulation of membrane protease activity